MICGFAFKNYVFTFSSTAAPTYQKALSAFFHVNLSLQNQIHLYQLNPAKPFFGYFGLILKKRFIVLFLVLYG